MELFYLLGKFLFGGFFVWNGIEHFMGLKALTGYAKHKGVPMAKEAVIVSGVILLLGGFSIILEQYVGFGILLLIFFMIITTFMMHRFWEEKEVAHKMNEKIAFQKNLALIGALLLLLFL